MISCELFCLMTGGFTCGSERDVRNVKTNARLVEFGKNMLANLTGLVGGTFCEENDDFAKFPIWTLGN